MYSGCRVTTVLYRAEGNLDLVSSHPWNFCCAGQGKKGLHCKTGFSQL